LPYHPKQKPRRGGGLRQINWRNLLQVNFLGNDIRHCCITIQSFYDMSIQIIRNENDCISGPFWGGGSHSHRRTVLEFLNNLWGLGNK
jgi:hypothetical protein